jgi:hypothetical protein
MGIDVIDFAERKNSLVIAIASFLEIIFLYNDLRT